MRPVYSYVTFRILLLLLLLLKNLIASVGLNLTNTSTYCNFLRLRHFSHHIFYEATAYLHYKKTFQISGVAIRAICLTEYVSKT